MIKFHYKQAIIVDFWTFYIQLFNWWIWDSDLALGLVKALNKIFIGNCFLIDGFLSIQLNYWYFYWPIQYCSSYSRCLYYVVIWALFSLSIIKYCELGWRLLLLYQLKLLRWLWDFHEFVILDWTIKRASSKIIENYLLLITKCKLNSWL